MFYLSVALWKLKIEIYKTVVFLSLKEKHALYMSKYNVLRICEPTKVEVRREWRQLYNQKFCNL